MENAVQERIQAKTRDSQLFEIFVNHFEFSPKTAEAAIHTVKGIYELHRFDPDRMPEIGQVIRPVISLKAKHGPRLRKLPKAVVRLTGDTGVSQRVKKKSSGKNRDIFHLSIFRAKPRLILGTPNITKTAGSMAASI